MASELKKALKQDEVGSDEVGHFNHHFSITMELEKHPLMMALAAAAVLIIIWYLYRSAHSQGQTTGTSTVFGTTTGTDATSPIVVQGTPGQTGTPGIPGPPGPPGTVGGYLNPFQGKRPGRITFGTTKVINGITYTLGTGPHGVWGVPGVWKDVNAWNQVPIGPGQKQLIYS